MNYNRQLLLKMTFDLWLENLFSSAYLNSYIKAFERNIVHVSRHCSHAAIFLAIFIEIHPLSKEIASREVHVDRRPDNMMPWVPIVEGNLCSSCRNNIHHALQRQSHHKRCLKHKCNKTGNVFHTALLTTHEAAWCIISCMSVCLSVGW